MVIALLAVIFMMFQFMNMSKSQQEENGHVGVRQPQTSTPVITPKQQSPSAPPLKDPGDDKATGVNGESLPLEVRHQIIDIEEKMLDPDPPQPGTPKDYDEVIAGIEDNREMEQKPLEPKAAGYVLHKIRTTPVDAPERVNAPTVTQRELGESPDKWRGKWVRIVGTVYDEFYGPEKVDEPGPSGVYVLYSNYLLDKSSQLLKVLSIDNQPELAGRQHLEVHGIFFKLDAILARNNEWGVLPVILTDRVAFYTPPEKEPTTLNYIIFAVILLGSIIMVVILVVGGTKGLGKDRKRRLEKRNRGTGADEQPGAETSAEPDTRK